jgi:hypothetical protein
LLAQPAVYCGRPCRRDHEYRERMAAAGAVAGWAPGGLAGRPWAAITAPLALAAAATSLLPALTPAGRGTTICFAHGFATALVVTAAVQQTHRSP